MVVLWCGWRGRVQAEGEDWCGHGGEHRVVLQSTGRRFGGLAVVEGDGEERCVEGAIPWLFVADGEG